MGSATKALFLATAILALSGTAGLGAPVPGGMRLDSPLRYPGAPKAPNTDPVSPYAMTYTDEAAQTLGIRNGHLDLFSSHPAPSDPLMPAVSGGLGGDGAMFKLQWRPAL